jgi:hypothetical protein
VINQKWSARRITDKAQHVLGQIPSRASDRGLRVLDGDSIVMMFLWSLLLWERTLGRTALERNGVDSFDLAIGVNRLLDGKASENPLVYDSKQGQLVFAKTREPYQVWDFNALLEPLLQTAEHEALALGHGYVGTEHLLLAVVRLADPALLEILQQRGVEYGKVKDAVLAVLSGE